jgi:hypothetical protein
MLGNTALYVGLLALAVCGCSPIPRKTVASVPQDSSVAIVDTLEQIGVFRVPETVFQNHPSRTLRAMSALSSQVDEFARSQNRLPLSIEELQTHLQGSATSPADAWGTPIGYRIDRIRYELRSSGADRIVNTPDDVVVVGVAGHTCLVMPGDGRTIELPGRRTACNQPPE